MPDQVVVNSGGFKPSPILKTCSEAKQNIVSSDSIKTETTSPASSNDSIPRESDSTKVDDPVKTFQEDLEMEGYTGMSCFLFTYFLNDTFTIIIFRNFPLKDTGKFCE